MKMIGEIFDGSLIAYMLVEGWARVLWFLGIVPGFLNFIIGPFVVWLDGCFNFGVFNDEKSPIL